MDHLTDKQILAFLTASGADDELIGHVAQCETCRRKAQAVKTSWAVLGQWPVEAPNVDLTDQILAQATVRHTILLRQPRALIRVAASILIGVGAGSWLGQTACD